MEAILIETPAAAAAAAVAPAARPKAAVTTTALQVGAAAPVFAGHFPGHPILPGVMLIGLARQAAAQALGRPLRLLRIVRLRFVRPVLPDMPLTLEHELAAAGADGGARKLVLRWKQADGTVCARGELLVG